jgi:hypothetical protein
MSLVADVSRTARRRTPWLAWIFLLLLLVQFVDWMADGADLAKQEFELG